MPYEQNKPVASILDSKPDTYQGSASPHSVMVKHINAVLAAEHRHIVEYQREREQHEAERRARHARERAEMAAQGYTPPVVLPAIDFTTDDNSTFDHFEDTDMNLKQLAATALTAGTIATATVGMTGCIPSGDTDQPDIRLFDPKNNRAAFKDFRFSPNPAPTQVRTLVVKVNNPPKDLIFDGTGELALQYNVEGGCLPQIDNFEGIQHAPYKFQTKVPIKQVKPNQFEVVLYDDAFEEKDYFGRGVCRFKLVAAFVDLNVQTPTNPKLFTLESDDRDKKLFSGGQSAVYFRRDLTKIEIFNKGYDGMSIKEIQNAQPEEYFTITLSFKK
jgi:hypothetical protein